MVKTKLLSTISAFILVLTLGACNQSEDNSVDFSDSSDTTDSVEIDSENESSTDSSKEDESSQEDLNIAAAILDVASSLSSSGYNSFEYLYYYSEVSQGGGQITYNVYDITLNSSSKIYGLRRIYDEDCTKESDAKFHYLVDGVDYYYNGRLENPSYTKSTLSYNTFNNLINANVGSGYNGAFTKASSIVLNETTNLEVKLIDDIYEVSFIYNDISYIYKADINFNLVAAGYSTDTDLGDYATSKGYESYYGELSSQARIDSAMSDFDINLWVN